MSRNTLPLLVALLCVGPVATADADILPADRPIQDVVDHHIDARLDREGIEPAPLVDDAGFLRRVSLDLIGRIPTRAELEAFLRSEADDKRTQLVDRLLQSDEFVRHQANEFDRLLMQDTRSSLREYFARAFAENRAWDQVFRELITGEADGEKRPDANAFLKDRIRDLDRLTNDVSVAFFGINISCARCHDHPEVEDWKQDHYYGMKSFFSRSFENGEFVGERDYGLISFKTTEGETKQARLMFLTGEVIEEPESEAPSNEERKAEKKRLEELKKKKQPPPPPEFSRRRALIETALEPGAARFLSRAIVNRLWYRLLGHGLVMPLDQMHSENEPSHPDLLAWLERDLRENGYDLKRLIRGVVLSEAYARSSIWSGDERPEPSLFAVATPRPLTREQYALSLKLASYDPHRFSLDLDTTELAKRLDNVNSQSRGMRDWFEQPREGFAVAVDEALLLSNSENVRRDLLHAGGDRLVGRLKAMASHAKRIDLAVRTVLSRSPQPEEAEILEDFLKRREDRIEEGCRQLVWALMTGSEFRFNH